MHDLVSRLVGLAEQLLEVTTSFFFKLLGMLEHRHIGCASELTEKCLDKNAAAFTKRPCFLSISHERLMEILARDSLCLREIDIYRAATKWARVHLKRANKRRTHRAIREVLGDALFLIRFPTMHPQEFKSGPAKDNVLSTEEKLTIYGNLAGGPRPELCAFSAEPRARVKTEPLRRFTVTQCAVCGARLNGDVCPECGCVYRPTAKCDQCGKRVVVDHANAFGWDYHNHDDGCGAVAYKCSCGAPNMITGYGGHECERCGLRVWRCVAYDGMSVGTCACGHCKENYGADADDDE